MNRPPDDRQPWGGGFDPSSARRSQSPVAGLGVASLVLAVVVTVLEGLQVLLPVSAPGPGVRTVLDDASNLTALVWAGAFVVSCLWLARVRRNSEVLAPTYHHVRSRGWVWWGWLVPVVSLWFPYQVVRDALDASAGASPGRAVRPRTGLWWAGFLVGQGLTGTVSGADVAGGGSAQPVVGLVGLAGLVVSLVLWFRIVTTVAVLQADAG